MNLADAVQKFSQAVQSRADAELDREWNWQGYEEGVRFGVFRTYEELRELAVRLAAQRAASTTPLTTAQRILAQNHAAYRDLQAVLLNLSDEQGERRPAEDEWPARIILAHTIETERTFFAINSYALRRARGRTDLNEDMEEVEWNRFFEGDRFAQIAESSPTSQLLVYYDELHERILRELSDITDEELSWPSRFWEPNLMPVEFRLHRFDSHLRQHTVQLEKTLAVLGFLPNEAQRLIRLVYNALAEVEGQAIGAWDFEQEARWSLGDTIAARTEEIDAILAKVNR